LEIDIVAVILRSKHKQEAGCLVDARSRDLAVALKLAHKSTCITCCVFPPYRCSTIAASRSGQQILTIKILQVVNLWSLSGNLPLCNVSLNTAIHVSASMHNVARKLVTRRLLTVTIRVGAWGKATEAFFTFDHDYRIE